MVLPTTCCLRFEVRVGGDSNGAISAAALANAYSFGHTALCRRWAPFGGNMSFWEEKGGGGGEGGRRCAGVAG